MALTLDLGLRNQPDLHTLLALRRLTAHAGALQAQRLARTGDFDVLITAQRGHRSVHAGQKVLRGGNADVALINLLPHMDGIPHEDLAVDLARVIEFRTFIGSTPIHEGLPASAMGFDGSKMAVAK